MYQESPKPDPGLDIIDVVTNIFSIFNIYYLDTQNINIIT